MLKKKRLQSLPKLVKKADVAFSRYIRLRDCEYEDGSWVGECITCNRKLVVVDASGHWGYGAHAGHYVSIGKKSTRWDEMNVNLQCAHCNLWMDKIEMLKRYRKALGLKYGDKTADRLIIEGRKIHKPTRDELLQIIHDSNQEVEWTLGHPNGILSELNESTS